MAKTILLIMFLTIVSFFSGRTLMLTSGVISRKETSVFSAVSLMDLMFTAKDLIGLYYKTTECLTLLVLFYAFILIPISVFGTVAERRIRHAGFGD